MDRKILYLLVIVCVLTAEVIVGVLTAEVQKANVTTRAGTKNELFFYFYKYKTSTPSSPGAASSINTCIAASRPPPIVSISVYALTAAGGTVFLVHRVKGWCFSSCFTDRRSGALTAATLNSCADAVESSGWANSFTFTNDGCVGYAAWKHSKTTQEKRCLGDVPVFVAENKINNFTDYEPPQIHVYRTVSRIGFDFESDDSCLTTAKVEVTSQLGSRTYENIFMWSGHYYLPFNISLCSLNPPAQTANVTFYDFDGRVLWRSTVERLGPLAPGGAMYPFTGDYGDLCVYQMAEKSRYINSAYADPCRSGAVSWRFRKTSFLTFAAYREIISTIPGGVPSHFVAASYHSETWFWGETWMPIGAEDFVSSSLPNNASGNCLIAKSDNNYLLEPIGCTTLTDVVCVDFSALSYPANFYN